MQHPPHHHPFARNLIKQRLCAAWSHRVKLRLHLMFISRLLTQNTYLHTSQAVTPKWYKMSFYFHSGGESAAPVSGCSTAVVYNAVWVCLCLITSFTRLNLWRWIRKKKKKRKKSNINGLLSIVSCACKKSHIYICTAWHSENDYRLITYWSWLYVTLTSAVNIPLIL